MFFSVCMYFSLIFFGVNVISKETFTTTTLNNNNKNSNNDSNNNNKILIQHQKKKKIVSDKINSQKSNKIYEKQRKQKQHTYTDI